MSYTVYVNAHDIHRILTTVGLPARRFLTFPLARNGESGAILREAIEFSQRDVALKQVGDGCVFLKQTHPLGCGIHDLKPGVCKAYPFTLENTDLVEISESLCPTKWHVSAEFGDAQISQIHRYRREWYFYYELIEEWNKRTRLRRSSGAFLKFLVERVERTELFRSKEAKANLGVSPSLSRDRAF